jgi:hypothetical protein
MVYVALNDEIIEKYAKIHPNISLYNKVVHPCKAELAAKDIQSQPNDYFIYDVAILDYIDPQNILFINEDLSVENFKDKFKEELDSMFPGEVLYNALSYIFP